MAPSVSKGRPGDCRRDTHFSQIGSEALSAEAVKVQLESVCSQVLEVHKGFQWWSAVRKDTLDRFHLVILSSRLVLSRLMFEQFLQYLQYWKYLRTLASITT